MRKIMYVALGFVVIGVLGVIMALVSSGAEAFTFSSENVHQTKDVSADGISSISINSPVVDVKVEPTSGKRIEADFSGQVGRKSKDLYKLDIVKNGDTVTIHMNKENKLQFLMFNVTRVSLTVKVPAKVYQSMKINAASGDISLDQVQANELAVETQSGDIDVKNIVTEDNLTLKASSGDITANDNQSNQLDIETSSGDITIRDNKIKTANLNSSSGDIVSDQLVSEDIKMNTSSGDISVKEEDMKGNVSLAASSGDIDVNFTKPVTSMKVDYKTSSGDGSSSIDKMTYSEKSEHRIIGQVGDGNFKLTARTSSGDFRVRD